MDSIYSGIAYFAQYWFILNIYLYILCDMLELFINDHFMLQIKKSSDLLIIFNTSYLTSAMGDNHNDYDTELWC